MCSRSVLGRQIALVKLLADNVLPGILVKARNGMNRRTFAQRASAAALSLPWKAKCSPVEDRRENTMHEGNRFSVMLWTLAKQATLDQSLEIVAAAGYSGVELTGQFQSWSEAEMKRVLSRMQTLGLTIDSISGVRAGFAVADQTAEFQTQFTEHLQFAQRLSCPQVILLSGQRVRSLAAEKQRQTAIDNLKWAGDRAGKLGIEIVIEPIDLLENPGVYLASVSDAFDLAAAVDKPSVKVLYDFYHEQRSFGNLIEKLERGINLIGLVHVADVPGRHEPGTGEIAYANLYQSLAKLDYKRRIAMEYYPTGDAVTSLRNAKIAFHAASVKH